MHTVNTFSSPEDLAAKLSRDFRRRFAESPGTDGANEYSESARLIDEFLLIPKRLNGTEVRLTVRFLNGFFPASRKLCRAFNLEYGSSVGAHIEILKPEEMARHKISEVSCAGDRFAALKELSAGKEAELYAELKFTDEDVPQTRGEFLGYTAMSFTSSITSFGERELYEIYGKPTHVPAFGALQN